MMAAIVPADLAAAGDAELSTNSTEAPAPGESVDDGPALSLAFSDGADVPPASAAAITADSDTAGSSADGITTESPDPSSPSPLLPPPPPPPKLQPPSAPTPAFPSAPPPATAAGPVSLPCLHTRAPPELGWPTMRCPSEGLQEMYDKYDKYRALHRTLVHAPLRGVNSSHLQWWFGSTLPSTVVYKGQKWDVYKLWHPVDHELFVRTSVPNPLIPGADGAIGAKRANAAAAAAATRAQLLPGSSALPLVVPAVRIVERFRGPLPGSAAMAQMAADGPAAAGPAAASDGSTASATTAADAGGDKVGSEPAAPAAPEFATYQLDTTMVLNDTQRNMHRLLFYIGEAPMQELYHTWEDTPAGAVVTTRFILGGRTEASAVFNDAILSLAFPPEQLEAWTLHSVEEFGNLPLFLPDIYAQRNGPFKTVPPGKR